VPSTPNLSFGVFHGFLANPRREKKNHKGKQVRFFFFIIISSPGRYKREQQEQQEQQHRKWMTIIEYHIWVRMHWWFSRKARGVVRVPQDRAEGRGGEVLSNMHYHVGKGLLRGNRPLIGIPGHGQTHHPPEHPRNLKTRMHDGEILKCMVS
jgi:hypothetical protein